MPGSVAPVNRWANTCGETRLQGTPRHFEDMVALQELQTRGQTVVWPNMTYGVSIGNTINEQLNNIRNATHADRCLIPVLVGYIGPMLPTGGIKRRRPVLAIKDYEATPESSTERQGDSQESQSIQADPVPETCMTCKNEYQYQAETAQCWHCGDVYCYVCKICKHCNGCTQIICVECVNPHEQDCVIRRDIIAQQTPETTLPGVST